MRTRPHLIGLVALAALTLPLRAGSSLARDASAKRAVLVYEGAATPVALPPNDLLDATSDHRPSGVHPDLWVTMDDLKRATGYEVKPQGVCRKELCFPLPKGKRNDYLAKRGATTWFNLSAFARLVRQPVAHDDSLDVWYFGTRSDVQTAFLDSLDAPNFTLPDVSGKTHALADFRGKKALLVTWASW